MKKKWMTAGSLMLSAALLLAGCGTGGGEMDATASAEGVQTQEASGQAEETASENDGKDPVLFDGEKTKLRVVFPGGTSSPADLEGVTAGINEIVSQYMDAEVELEILEWGVYSDQQKLMLSSGEDIALIFTMDSSRNYAASNQVRDITELCETYAADALESFGIYAEACLIDGKYYGLPTFHEYTKDSGLICRTDILEELGIDPAEVKTWDDIEGVLAQVKDVYPEMNVLCPVETGAGILDYYNEGKFDELTSGVVVRVDSDGSEVLNMYDTPEFMELAQRAYDWNQKGYFMADATTVTDTRQDLLAAGNTFGYIGQIHPGTATQELKNSGVEVTTIPAGERALTTGNVNFAQYMVPTGCTAPEKAVKLLDIMLTNADIANLLMYGVEGTDYVIKDEDAGIVGYPEGVDSSSVGWNNETWLAGNGSLAYVWESDPADIWEQYEEFNASAVQSPLYGFTFDTANVKTEITAIANVIQKYEAVICAGYSEPEEAVAQMVSELQAAGIERVMEEAGTQIEVWKSNNQ